MTPQFTIEPGAAEPIVMRLKGRDGAPLDTSAATLQMRIKHDGACLVLDGTRRDDGSFSIDMNGLSLPSRLGFYLGIIYIDWGVGWRRSGQVSFGIAEGC